VFATWAEAAHRDLSGSPAFQRPSISSFEFDCRPRAIHADMVKPVNRAVRGFRLDLGPDDDVQGEVFAGAWASPASNSKRNRAMRIERPKAA